MYRRLIPWLMLLVLKIIVPPRSTSVRPALKSMLFTRRLVSQALRKLSLWPYKPLENENVVVCFTTGKRFGETSHD